MSIQSEIDRISGNVQDTISTIQQTGVSVPSGANSNNLPSLAAALANTKQDKLSGQQGQVVGFDAEGNAVAQAAPSGGITQEAADDRYLKLAGGTMTGAIAMGGNKITGLAAPTEDTDAARKQDVDDFEPKSSAVQLSAAAQAALGLGSGSTLDDAMELLAKGETLFETTINQSGQQINVAIDPSTWSKYTYVIVDLGLPVPAATGIYYIRMNNSASTSQGCNYLVNNFNDNWSHDNTFIGYLWKRLVGTLNARLIFYVGKDNTNDITVFTVCGESYCVGHFQNQRYVTSTSINIVGASSSTIGAGATVRIWGVK